MTKKLRELNENLKRAGLETKESTFGLFVRQFTEQDIIYRGWSALKPSYPDRTKDVFDEGEIPAGHPFAKYCFQMTSDDTLEGFGNNMAIVEGRNRAKSRIVEQLRKFAPVPEEGLTYECDQCLDIIKAPETKIDMHAKYIFCWRCTEGQLFDRGAASDELPF